jgi:outer membrane protein OmpA-like peptidoglycan-associated protein
MSFLNLSFFRARTMRRVACVALGSVALAQAAHADGPVMNEQDITEQSVTNALAPGNESGDDSVLTRGFVLSNKAPGAPHPSPAKQHAAQMLITFTTNSATLTKTAQAALDRVARALQSEKLAAYRFRVEGHADPRGSADVNQKLSEARAAAVVDYLTQQDGIAPERLTSVGKGSTDLLNRRNPAAPENRRVTIVTVTD